jgi:hypothetical protein
MTLQKTLEHDCAATWRCVFLCVCESRLADLERCRVGCFWEHECGRLDTCLIQQSGVGKCMWLCGVVWVVGRALHGAASSASCNSACGHVNVITCCCAARATETNRCTRSINDPFSCLLPSAVFPCRRPAPPLPQRKGLPLRQGKDLPLRSGRRRSPAAADPQRTSFRCGKGTPP